MPDSPFPTAGFFLSCFPPRLLVLLCSLLWLAACQERRAGEGAAVPPVGHFEGSIQAAGVAETRAALDIRHPSPGHYEAEFTVPEISGLNFVADTIFLTGNQLRLTRPNRPGQVLHLTLDGDFWRGTLQLDSLEATAILVKRGPPAPSTYRVEELPQDHGSAWLFSPADTETRGLALAMLPDSATAEAAALWGDALARAGVIVLVLPATTMGTDGLGTALRLLRTTPGADTATIGVWAAGQRAALLAQELVGPGGARAAFVVAQQVDVTPEVRADFRELARRKLPVLGLYGGRAGALQAARLRGALGGRRTSVLAYPSQNPALLVPGPVGTRFGPGLPGAVTEWLQTR